MNSSEVTTDNTPKIKKIQQPKIKFEEFKDRLELLILDGKDNKQLNKVYNLLKQGFDGVASQEKVNDVFSVIQMSDCFPFLSIKISLDVSCGSRSSELFRKLMRKNREEAAIRSNFPYNKIPLFSNANDSGRLEVLRSWILENIYKAENPLEWSRYAISCLISDDIISDEFEAIRFIVQKLSNKIDKSKMPSVKNKFSKFIYELGILFTQKEFSPAKLANLFSIINVFETKYNEILKENKSMLANFEEIKERKIELENLVGILERDKKNTMASIANLQEMVVSKDLIIYNEQEKHKSLEEYWQHESARELAGYTHSIKNTMSHEINEARLSLEGDNPDIKMALSRLKNMHKLLEKVAS